MAKWCRMQFHWYDKIQQLCHIPWLVIIYKTKNSIFQPVMFVLRKSARFQNVHFFSRVFKTLQLFCMSSSWSLCLKSTQGGQPVLVKACPTVTPVQPALNPSITFLTWTTRSQSEEKLKSTRPFWKPVREHFRYFCSALRFDFQNINFLIGTDSNHQIKRVIPSTSSENEAFVVYC